MESVAQLKDINTQKKGLLYGVPISIKDNVAYEVNMMVRQVQRSVFAAYVTSCLCEQGRDTSCGVVSKLDQPVLGDSVVVKVLKKQGAIPFIKTNIPQGLLKWVNTVLGGGGDTVIKINTEMFKYRNKKLPVFYHS